MTTVVESAAVAVSTACIRLGSVLDDTISVLFAVHELSVSTTIVNRARTRYRTISVGIFFFSFSQLVGIRNNAMFIYL